MTKLSLEECVVGKIKSCNTRWMSNIRLNDSDLYQKKVRKPLMEGKPTRKLPTYNMSLEKGHLKFGRHILSPIACILNDVDYTWATGLVCNFFLSVDRNIYCKDSDVCMTMPEFEHATKECQKKCINLIRIRYDFIYFEIDCHNNWFRGIVYQAIRQYCALNNLDLAIICLDPDIQKEDEKLFVEEILDFVTDFMPEGLFKYYVRSMEFHDSLIKDEWQNSSFDNLGDCICTICYFPFCNHIQQGLVQQRSTVNFHQPSTPCSSKCFLNGVLSSDVEFHYQYTDLNETELLSLLYKCNSPCLVASVAGIPCYVIYTIAYKSGFNLIPNKELAQVDYVDVENTGRFHYTVTTLMKICIKGRQDHPNLLCTSNCIGPYIKLSSGCDCTNGCGINCACFERNKECNPSSCNCCQTKHSVLGSWNCKNIGLTLSRRKKIAVHKSKVHNYGLFTKENILANELIGEYCGELISEKECERREPIYDLLFLNYMFDLTKQWIIDAHYIGNELRFANHDDRIHNCLPRVMLLSSGEIKIGLYANTNISKGEELLFDYGNNYKKHLKV
eukprot:NODE_118_length_18285_cov_1.016606.p5 type:complete len:559 gc:universal NODE_118_length_18285_cov_1.016606:15544-17220(+)